MSDFYKTLKGVSQGIYKEKMSKFIAIAQPAQSADEAKALIKQIANKYHDARHCCWAYMIGTQRNEYLSSDNGEPSGTAGKPILGQINSKGLTDIIILVVRYFGGVKLGTSGLISAYRTAAAEAISAAEIISKTVDAECHFSFEYPMLSGVMKVVRDMDARILKQDFGMQCNLTLSIRRGKKEELTEKINKALSPF
ncbi:MAG: YigZ family protein [Muribaculaceae bacterium]|nr:YigZ family protein [Muribaculaceae bacterium]